MDTIKQSASALSHRTASEANRNEAGDRSDASDQSSNASDISGLNVPDITKALKPERDDKKPNLLSMAFRKAIFDKMKKM